MIDQRRMFSTLQGSSSPQMATIGNNNRELARGGGMADETLPSPSSGCSSVLSSFSSSASSGTSEVDITSCTPAPTLAGLSLGTGLREGSSSKSSGGSSCSGDVDDVKDKKYYCQRCLNHKEQHPRKGHKPFCDYRNCKCNECNMVEKRRCLNNALNTRKPGEGKLKGLQQGPKARNPKCARCTAHGAESALRGHKKTSCPFLSCPCEKCVLVQERRQLMAAQIKLRRKQKKAREGDVQEDDTGDVLSEQRTNTSTPPALAKCKKNVQKRRQKAATFMPPPQQIARPDKLLLPSQHQGGHSQQQLALLQQQQDQAQTVHCFTPPQPTATIAQQQCQQSPLATLPGLIGLPPFFPPASLMATAQQLLGQPVQVTAQQLLGQPVHLQSIGQQQQQQLPFLSSSPIVQQLGDFQQQQSAAAYPPILLSELLLLAEKQHQAQLAMQQQQQFMDRSAAHLHMIAMAQQLVQQQQQQNSVEQQLAAQQKLSTPPSSNSSSTFSIESILTLALLKGVQQQGGQ